MAAFIKGDLVKISAKAIAAGTTVRSGGVVKHVACYLATAAGGKTCDKKTCAHAIKDYVWVSFPTGTFSYHHEELDYDGVKATTVMPDAKEFAAKAADAAATIRRAKEDGTLGADNGRMTDVDWKIYTTKLPGDTQTRTARRMTRTPEVIESDDEINWAAYIGIDRTQEPGSYRKRRSL